MKAQQTLRIHAQWLDKGHFILWSEPYKRPHDIIGKLFTYHKPSYYGTFIHTEQQGIREMIVLPAIWSVDYWLQLPVNEHISFLWSERAKRYRHLAETIRTALREDWIMPDFSSWLQGSEGWRIAWDRWLRADLNSRLDRELTPEDRMFADRWISQFIQACLTHPEELSRGEMEELLPSWERCLATYMKQQEMARSEWIDEGDWLQALGWVEDPAPFRLALQLSEPDVSGAWRLSIRVQDRQDPLHVITCSTTGEVISGNCPADWEPYLADRLVRETRKIINVIEQLADPEESMKLMADLDDEQAWNFLMEWSPRLLKHGVQVLLPSWWERIHRARPRLHTRILSKVSYQADGQLGLRQLLEFDWQVSIGDLELTQEEYEKLVADQKKLASIRGRWVVVDQVMLQSIQRKLRRYSREGGIPLQDVLEYGLLRDVQEREDLDPYALPDSLAALIDLELGPDIEALLDLLRRVHKPPLIPVPQGLQGQLRPYQHEGVSWLTMLRALGVGGCLADDMGLGKTIQFIAYALHLKESEGQRGPSLLICPTSVLGNWQKEFERFAPSLDIHLHHGPARLRGESLRQTAMEVDVVLTTYSLAALDRDELNRVNWDAICLDEAQNIKNHYTKQAQAIQTLSARHRIAMTGTPIENRLSELWSIMNFVNPGYLGSLRSFDRVARQIERDRDSGQLRLIQAQVRPFLLRREKHDPAISLDLPSKEELKCYVSLTPEQSAIYEQQLDGLFNRIDRLHMMERRGAVLSTIMRLKQLCDHPALLHRDYHLPIEELLEQSNKLMRLTEMVEEVREAGERCLIFTQFIDMGHLLQSVLGERLGEKVMFMHGGISKMARDEMIAEFQREEQDTPCGVFILSLKTGGTGLNLTAANHVFHYDRWWNPAVENQASDRVYRIGQERKVFVHKFISIGTLEEKIDAMLEQKMGLSRRVVGGGEHWISELSNEELRQLLALRTI